MYLSGIVFLVAAYGMVFQMFPEANDAACAEEIPGSCIATTTGNKIFGCILIGLITGMAIGKTTEYFTSFDFGPVISIKDRGVTGPATVVIQGIGVGMIS